MLCRAHPTKFYIFLYPSSCFYNGSSKKLSFIYFTNTQIFYKKIEIGSFIGLNKEYNRKHKNK